MFSVILNDLRFSHPSNAPAPIEMSLCGNFIDFSFLQSANAQSHMILVPSFIL